jgi:hypothetical protein
MAFTSVFLNREWYLGPCTCRKAFPRNYEIKCLQRLMHDMVVNATTSLTKTVVFSLQIETHNSCTHLDPALINSNCMTF